MSRFGSGTIVVALLACAWPAAARDRSAKPVAAAPTLVPTPRDANSRRGPANAEQFTDRQYPPADGLRPGMLGSWRVGEDTDLGVGLYTVDGTRVRERDFRRSDPVRDITPKGRRVAAVGLSLHF
jgi:hypothetical protein